MKNNKMKKTDFDVPEIDFGAVNPKPHAPDSIASVATTVRKPKIVNITLEGDEITAFEDAFKASTSKAERAFAKSIVLNHIAGLVRDI